MAQKRTLEIRVSILLGMVGQLQVSRGTKLLAPLGLNRSKLAVLQYVADHEATTIAEMSERLEINQPGITKIVQQFIAEGLLKAGELKTDKRVKHLTITKKGLAKCKQTFNALLPDISEPYQDWPVQELEAFASYLERLKTWLDENR